MSQQMNASIKTQAVYQLKEIAKELKRLGAESKVLERPSSGQNFMHDHVWIYISAKGLEKHEQLILFLYKNGWGDKFSEKYLDDKLRSVYARYVQAPSDEMLAGCLKEIADEYESYRKEHIVIVPLAGIVLENDSLELGNIVLRKATPEYLKKRILISAEELPDELVNDFIQDVLKGRSETVCAEYKIVAEQDRAEERAIDECNRTLDVLRFAIPVLDLPHLKIAIGFEHEKPEKDWLHTYTLEVGNNQKRSGSDKNFSFFPLKLNADSIVTLDGIGALKLFAALKKERLTDFEQALLRGVHWYSTSQKTIEPENKFLNLITCLETFFTPKTRDPIANAVAEGCAFVLGEEAEKRKLIYRRVKQFYGARSGLSHGGKTAVLESEIKEAEWIAWHVIVSLLAKLDNFQTQEALWAWIEEQKFN